MNVDYAVATHIGQVKERNEDAYVCDADLGLFVVADGMGGHAGGDVASQEVVRVIGEELSAQRETLSDLTAAGDGWEVQAVLETAIQKANTVVCDKAAACPELEGMGSTASLVWLRGERATIAHVGDSRAYLIRDGEPHFMTQDHSLIQELIRQGRLTVEEARDFPYKTIITRSLGTVGGVEVDTLDFNLHSDDRLLICSDGLYRYLQEGELVRLIDERPAQEIVDGLINLANERGGMDNITAILINVQKVESTGESKRKIEVFEDMPLFQLLSHRDILTVLNATSMRHYHAGQVIFEDGVLGDELFVILSGAVNIVKKGVVLARLGAGDHFGEMALVDDSPRSATALVPESARLLVLTRERFYSLLRRESVLAVDVLWNFLQVLVGRLRSTSQELTTLKQDSAAAKRRRDSGGVPRKIVIQMSKP